jgi:hypothetical protein
MRRIGLAMFLFVLVGRVAAAADDVKPPVIKHVPPTKLVKGEPLTLSAEINDDHEVWAPTLHHRTPGAKKFTEVSLEPKKGSTFAATITPTGDLEYWLEAYDEFGNGPARKGTREKPIKVLAEKGPVQGKVEAAGERSAALPQPPPPLPPPAAAPAPAPAAPPSALVVPAAGEVAQAPVSVPSAALAAEPVPSASTVDGATASPRKWWIIGGAGAALLAGGVTAALILLVPSEPETTYRGVTSATLARPASSP